MVPKTHREVRSFVQFCNSYAKFIHHFSDMSAPSKDLMRKSQPTKIVMTPLCVVAFETLKLCIFSAPCLVLPEFSSDATFIVATNASAVDIVDVLLQDHGGGVQPPSCLARKINIVVRGNSYSENDLEALAVCEAMEMLPESLFQFLVVSDHDALRHLLKHPIDMFNQRHTIVYDDNVRCYVRDLQSFTMTTIARVLGERLTL
jgi:hypothetical protein